MPSIDVLVDMLVKLGAFLTVVAVAWNQVKASQVQASTSAAISRLAADSNEVQRSVAMLHKQVPPAAPPPKPALNTLFTDSVKLPHSEQLAHMRDYVVTHLDELFTWSRNLNDHLKRSLPAGVATQTWVADELKTSLGAISNSIGALQPAVTDIASRLDTIERRQTALEQRQTDAHQMSQQAVDISESSLAKTADNAARLDSLGTSVDRMAVTLKLKLATPTS